MLPLISDGHLAWEITTSEVQSDYKIQEGLYCSGRFDLAKESKSTFWESTTKLASKVSIDNTLFIKNQRVFHKNLTNSTMQFQRRGLPRNHHGWYNRKWHWRSNWKASDVDKTHNFWIKLLKTILNRWLLIQTYFNHLLERKTYLFQRNRAFLAFPNIDQSLIFSPSTDPVLCISKHLHVHKFLSGKQKGCAKGPRIIIDIVALAICPTKAKHLYNWLSGESFSDEEAIRATI